MQRIKAYKRKATYVLLLLGLMFSSNNIFAQATIPVTGNVIDDRGDTMVGASVLIKGTTIGTEVDLQGDFTLNVPNPDIAILQISYIGYETQDVPLRGRTNVDIILKDAANFMDEVTIVAYGTQRKETLTGAISSVGTDALLKSPNASIANSLAGKITGLSSIQQSGQPGAEDPTLYIRGGGSLTNAGSQPLILVDGVERSFFQMDPNEIESVTVLKDASATAVFGVRGANGVILVTTRRGKEGETKISINSSVSLQAPTKTLDMTDSYTYAMMHNEQERNDGRAVSFDDYSLERFRLGDEPMMYPDIKWRDYLTNDVAIQTQHNINITGGTEKVRYFISLGYLFQDGLFKDFGNDESAYKYNRYNYRANLDIDITKSTLLKIGIGGIVADKNEPYDSDDLWMRINRSQPFSSPGIIDGIPMVSQARYPNIKQEDPIAKYYGYGYKNEVSNTMNLDMSLSQQLDFITEGLSIEVKGAYNISYDFNKIRRGYTEIYTPFYESAIDGSNLAIEDPSYNKDIVYKISGSNAKLGYAEQSDRGRDWYFETSLRYKRGFGDHNVSALVLYNQDKKYYPTQFSHIPSSYVGLVGRVTYDYKTRYLAEFNVGYNGSENFAPGMQFGVFPSVSLGYILTEEPFMKNQKVLDMFKIRVSVGLVGNDNMSNNRFLYLPNSYLVDQEGLDSSWKNDKWGYNFGFNNSSLILGSIEGRIGNPNVTWETALKQNYGLDMQFLDRRLKVTLDYFRERREDILISRNTIPGITSLSPSLLSVVNLGIVENNGFEAEISWSDKIGNDFIYFANANVSYSKNKIIYQDEVEPNEPYLSRTGQPVGAIFGYVAEGMYGINDFTYGELNSSFPDPGVPVYPGDVKYKDLNNDGVINDDDQMNIGHSTRPSYVFGLNLGLNYKGLFFSMHWSGAAERSLLLQNDFREAFAGENRGLMNFHVENRWTPETATTAKYPRFSSSNSSHNYKTSTMWIEDGSYIKLKNLTLGYAFEGNEKLKKVGISRFELKFTGYNLLTFDNFKIMDPESNPSHANDTYPVVQNFSLGVNIVF